MRSRQTQSASFGGRLAGERIRLGLTQIALASRVGVSKKSVLAWENGHFEPNVAYLRLMAAEGIDIVFVLFGMSEPAVRDFVSKAAQAVVAGAAAAQAVDQKEGTPT